MTTQLTLNIALRGHTGRSASRRLRKVNRIPAILYGKHTQPEKLSIEVPEFVRLIKSVAGRAVLIELQRSDNSEKTLTFLQEVQRDPITDRYLHVDLHEVKADEKFEIRVQLSIVGESFGVKNQSGVLETPTQQVRIRCLPKDLPPKIEVDVTELKVGDTIHIGELKPIAGVEYLDNKNQPVVSCVEPVEEEVAATPATPAAGEAAAPAAGAAAPEGATAPAGDAKPGEAAKPGDAKGAAPAKGDAKAGAAPAKGMASAKGAAPAKDAKPAKK
ncbi:MAG: 50S ribosomal protein L25 [Opitutaceae bacterium]|jgi:large subunit ribosomal protein L25